VNNTYANTKDIPADTGEPAVHISVDIMDGGTTISQFDGDEDNGIAMTAAQAWQLVNLLDSMLPKKLDPERDKIERDAAKEHLATAIAERDKAVRQMHVARAKLGQIKLIVQEDS
jgi:hypothetical protein